MMLPINFPYVVFIMLRYIPSIPSFCITFNIKWY
jgi:hypothetical protein